MRKQSEAPIKAPDLSSLSAAELRLVMAQMQQQFQTVIDEQSNELKAAHRTLRRNQSPTESTEIQC